MDLAAAVKDVLLGASLRQVAAAHREDLIHAFGFRADEVTDATFATETAAFVRKLARQLGDQFAGHPGVGQALRDHVLGSELYEVWDALLSGFDFEDRAMILRRGRMLFPGPLTAHWPDA